MTCRILKNTVNHPNLDDIPQYDLPEGYSFHWYEPGDEAAWTAIHLVADRYNDITPALFASQFGTDTALLHERQCYLQDAAGNLIGTTSAWFNDDYRGLPYGQIHWVAIVPEMQGKGLAKPLLSVVCERLKALGHERAYLETSGGTVASGRAVSQIWFPARSSRRMMTSSGQKSWNA